MQLDF